MSAERLYTPEVLALATTLASWPWDPTMPLLGEARSRSCGSSLELGLSLDEAGKVAKVGLRARACAIGQAAAAIFASGVVGRDGRQIDMAASSLALWLAKGGPQPDWPGIGVLASARAVPGRHEAIMLAWNAARDLLPSK